MKTPSSGFIFLGLLWALAIYWMVLGMDAITDRVSVSPIGTALLIGPILLICGPILVWNGSHAKLGSILTLLGCAILTAYVGYGVSGLFSMSWFDAKPFFPVFAVLVTITLLCDAGAIRLYQLACSAAVSQPH